MISPIILPVMILVSLPTGEDLKLPVEAVFVSLVCVYIVETVINGIVVEMIFGHVEDLSVWSVCIVLIQ